ncbi:helix-turn-helix transcriptional regulator [Micromonospora sp. WMMD1082]|uniref:helix-turn-helix transcriptional regulator n=1 Tax=Micromonospora sp. WMMD1082 TaxID=3016104 RepID=UPI0024174421|nr:helix-turn-helix transcriptional regulator [Micromonospora sp. WMMD1082]MDG4797684.1 helix-turn-helix transcriptional regulator [Micromonospora sp. WMMD1082]
MPGLRREEVAQLVAISIDYYTRIEQGRLAPSEPVLAALVRTLRLDDEQSDYLRALLTRAGTPPVTRAHDQNRRRTRAVRPQLQRLLGQLDRTPALVFGRHLDILAWNDLAAALLLDFADIAERDRNYVRLVFTDPTMRDLYPQWEQVARTCVAVLRMSAAGNPTDPALSRLVGDLSMARSEFRQWWAERRVAHQDFGTKLIRHPQVGDMHLDWDSFHQAANPDQQLVIWSAEPGSDSAHRLDTLRALIKDTPAHPA